tara:strand:+ start:59 stop:448 length:390 start_codon:yes stop_codon:yes gene_type:complete
MKSFDQFRTEQAERLDEIAPLALGALALKGAGLGLSIHSGIEAIKSAKKGKWKDAAFNTLGAIPGGRVFKGMKALGAGKKLSKAGSFVQSTNRWNIHGLTPNAREKAVTKLEKPIWDAGVNLYNRVKKK